MMGMGLYAKLQPHMIKQADAVGNARQDSAEKAKRPHTAFIPKEKLRQNNINAARAERATQIFFPTLVWHGYREYGFRGLPDLGTFIDVKCNMREGPDVTLNVKRDRDERGDCAAVIPDWAYVLAVGDCHPYWWIVGWMWGREVVKGELRWAPNEGYCIPCKKLEPIYLLQAIVKRESAHEGSNPSC